MNVSLKRVPVMARKVKVSEMMAIKNIWGNPKYYARVELNPPISSGNPKYYRNIIYGRVHRVETTSSRKASNGYSMHSYRTVPMTGIKSVKEFYYSSTII